MKLAIFGLARSGLSALKYLSTTKHDFYAINEGEPESWESFEQVSNMLSRDRMMSQDDALELFGQMDLIIKSPGIPFTHKALEKAREAKVEIISEIEFAFRRSDIPVIAITGTNGKTTTATMISDLLTKLGKKVFLGGNIGIPYSDVLISKQDYDIAVIEVSSFQLENIQEFNPQIAVLTNISPSHAERYESHELYRNAKLKMFQNMEGNQLALLPQNLFELNLACKKMAIKKLEGFDLSNTQLVGQHNFENLYCAYICASELIHEQKLVDKAVQEYINEFVGVPYRMQPIQNSNGLKVINDGKSTNIAATAAALDSFQDKEVRLILGGKLRSEDLDFSELKKRKINKIFAFGEAAQFINKNLSKDFDLETFETLDELMEKVKEEQPKGVLLFSPAFPSFDLYKNYEERAKAFNDLTKRLLN